jgi:hypothetical protein
MKKIIWLTLLSVVAAGFIAQKDSSGSGQRYKPRWLESIIFIPLSTATAIWAEITASRGQNVL